jgi:hypothetical protein
MSGYVPLFGSIATGTLYGRWPDIGLWPIVLALADKYGVLDVTPHYLSGVTGLPVQDVVACMERFCAPDPYSRTKEEGGARLKLLDDHRDWGWIIVNHSKYREKARMAAKSAREVEEGKNKERMEDRRRPPETAAHRPSNSYANSNTNINPKRAEGVKNASSEKPKESAADRRQSVEALARIRERTDRS